MMWTSNFKSPGNIDHPLGQLKKKKRIMLGVGGDEEKKWTLFMFLARMSISTKFLGDKI